MSEPAARSLIVVAEDSADLRKLLADGLTRVGFAVVEAENGAALVEKVVQASTEAPPGTKLALIVTDVRMPVMDGISAIQAVRAHAITTPVIFITAYGDPSSRGAVENLHSRWIEKPVGLNSLRSAVAEALGLEPLVPPEAL